MTIFLILAPYAAFTLLMLVSSPLPSLLAAAAICGIVIGYDVLGGRSIKLLGASSAILFTSLGGYLILVDPGLSPSATKLAVDCGLFAIALLSLAIRFPFTLQYAREAVDAQTAGLPGFLTAGPAALVGIGDCVRRPQHRALFYQLVSAIPAREIRRFRRRSVRFLKHASKIQPSQPFDHIKEAER